MSGLGDNWEGPGTDAFAKRWQGWDGEEREAGSGIRVDVAWKGPGAAIQKYAVPIEECQEGGKYAGSNWVVYGADGRNFGRSVVAEELAAVVEEAIESTDHTDPDAVELQGGGEPSAIARRMEELGRDTLYIDPDSSVAQRWLNEAERRALRERRDIERATKPRPTEDNELREAFEETRKANQPSEPDKIESLSRKLEQRSKFDADSSDTWADYPLAEQVGLSDSDVEEAHIETVAEIGPEDSEEDLTEPEGTPEELSDYWEFEDGSVIVTSAHPAVIEEMEVLVEDGDAVITERAADGKVTAELPDGMSVVEERLSP